MDSVMSITLDCRDIRQICQVEITACWEHKLLPCKMKTVKSFMISEDAITSTEWNEHWLLFLYLLFWFLLFAAGRRFLSHTQLGCDRGRVLATDRPTRAVSDALDLKGEERWRIFMRRSPAHQQWCHA